MDNILTVQEVARSFEMIFLATVQEVAHSFENDISSAAPRMMVKVDEVMILWNGMLFLLLSKEQIPLRFEFLGLEQVLMLLVSYSLSMANLANGSKVIWVSDRVSSFLLICSFLSLKFWYYEVRPPIEHNSGV